MAETAVKPTPIRGDTEPETEGTGGGGKDPMGRVLDVAGVIAAVALGVIIFDMLSGGKVTRLLRGKGGCEGCGEIQEPTE
jgi:hypothetical protein